MSVSPQLPADPRGSDLAGGPLVASPSQGGQAITNAVVGLLRSHAGRGPTKARTVVSSDLIVVHLRDCLTVGEKTIHDSGQRELLARVRDVLHDAIREEATAAVEEISGRRVVAYMHSQEADPDHALLAFVLDGHSGC